MNISRIAPILILVFLVAATDIYPQENTPQSFQADYSEKISQAQALQKKVLAYYEKKFGLLSPKILKPMEALAWMAMEQGDFSEVENLCQRVINIRTYSVSPSAENTELLGTA